MGWNYPQGKFSWIYERKAKAVDMYGGRARALAELAFPMKFLCS